MNNIVICTNIVCLYTRYTSNRCKVDLDLGKVVIRMINTSSNILEV
jgi:hypothetical protein